MTPIYVDLALVEPGSVPMLITSSHPDRVADLPAAVTPRGEVLSRWRLTDAERQAVSAGADLYLFIQTGGRPVQPVSLVVGPEAGLLPDAS